MSPSLTPDLLGRRKVVELKTHDPRGERHDLDAIDRQVHGYLAWAMVELGAEWVAREMRGWVVHLHPEVRPEDRVRSVSPDVSRLGRRIYNRHRLLALSSGSWLPAPDSECRLCELSEPEMLPSGARLPAACTFYCQNERGWDCHGPDRVCPLIGRCDQYDRYEDPEKLDRFNRARLDLLDEEEQLAALSEVAEAASGGELGELAGLRIGPFEVADYLPPVLALRVGGAWRRFQFAAPGMTFRLSGADRRDLGRAVFRRDRGDGTLEFRFGALSELATGTSLWLVTDPGDVHPVREQLGFLDLLERSGREPLAVGRPRRDGTTSVTVPVESFARAPQDARVVLIDARGRLGESGAVEQVLREVRGKVLLISPLGWPLPNLTDLADLDGDALAETWAGTRGSVRSRATELVERLRAARVWAAPRELLFDGSLDRFLTAPPSFEVVVVAAAQTLPLVAVDRCLELGRRLVLVGDAAAGGPRAESPRARRSLLFQNTLALLLEAGPHLLPSSVPQLAVVRQRYQRAALGLQAVTRVPDPRSAIPVFQHPVSGGAAFSSLPAAELTVEVPPTDRSLFARTLDVSVEDWPSLRHLRLLVRNLQPAALEACRVLPGGVDDRLFGYRVRVLTNVTENQPADGGRPHRVRVRVPAETFPGWQERCGRNPAEADTLVGYAVGNNTRRYVASSPFFAQCVEIARRAAGSGIDNLVVRPLESLGWLDAQNEELLVSLVAGAANPSFPFPLGEPGRLLELFSGRFNAVRLFASPDLLAGHPLLNRLVVSSGV